MSDCLTHACKCRDENDLGKSDACCQHGADVHIPEKHAILRRADQIASVLKPERRDPGTWFDEREPGEDPEAPLGIVIRTATSDLDDDSSGCVFLQHTGERGCGLHVAARGHGFEPSEIKPLVCQLYPLSLEQQRLTFSDDFYRYSCAASGSDSVYRVMRETLGTLFGADAIAALDRLEARLRTGRLRVLQSDDPVPARGDRP